ncbi:hypothetical protein EU527_06350 [Candidatus Thorarchaeota archaeon]|nr:MAG: hypothetical protein EU527_06350 [Candidatus Thorarchaeota archaeon]
MNEHPLPDYTALFSELVCISQTIQSGRKGIDFLVLENDDEMYGYQTTPLEEEFCNIVTKIVELLEEKGESLLSNHPQLACSVIKAIVHVQPAVDAYRSRMFRYATDWGSEVSPIAGCQRELLLCIKDTLSKISMEDNEKISSILTDELKNSHILTYYWTDWDRHGSTTTRVIDLFK